MNTPETHITLTHFENGEKTFLTAESFITFVSMLFAENEEEDTNLSVPIDIMEAVKYISEYCHNWKIQTLVYKHHKIK